MSGVSMQSSELRCRVSFKKCYVPWEACTYAVHVAKPEYAMLVPLSRLREVGDIGLQAECCVHLVWS